MAQTKYFKLRVPPDNPFPHSWVEPDPNDPTKYRECCVYDRSTGERLVRSKVDCRELLASGRYVASLEECDLTLEERVATAVNGAVSSALSAQGIDESKRPEWSVDVAFDGEEGRVEVRLASETDQPEPDRAA